MASAWKGLKLSVGEESFERFEQEEFKNAEEFPMSVRCMMAKSSVENTTKQNYKDASLSKHNLPILEQ